MKNDIFTAYIPGNVPSLKNSKIKTSRGIFPSKTVMKYLRELGIKRYSTKDKIVEEFAKKPNLFRESLINFPKLQPNDYPLIIGFHFIRKTKADFDFNNATQIIQDLLVAHNFIIDDSLRHLIPEVLVHDSRYYSIDKEKAGVIIQVKYGINHHKNKKLWPLI